MSSILELINSYKNNGFPQHQSHYEGLKDGQQPHTLLITCSDSRLCPQEFTQTQGGELFIIRNAGNLVPAYSQTNISNEGLTLEYGVCALNVKQVVVCGHAKCGAMGGLMALDQLSSLPLVQKGLTDYKNAFKNEVESLGSPEEAINWNVKNQLKSLLTYPFVKERVANGSLKLVGVVYNFTNASLDFQCGINANGEFTDV